MNSILENNYRDLPALSKSTISYNNNELIEETKKGNETSLEGQQYYENNSNLLFGFGEETLKRSREEVDSANNNNTIVTLPLLERMKSSGDSESDSKLKRAKISKKQN